jgi:ATP-dependent helicase/nuclease subunit B
MRRLITSRASENRLNRAAEFLADHAGQEILVVARNRTAADELIRSRAMQSAGVFGAYRFSLPQLAPALAAGPLAEIGTTLLAGVAVDAIAARSVHACRTQGQLEWFEPVANTPGFYRALASTISELRLNDVAPQMLSPSGPAGRDLAKLLEEFRRHQAEGGTADLATVYKTAAQTIRNGSYRFRGMPLLLLDVGPTHFIEREFLGAMVEAASNVFATVHQRDAAAVQVLKEILSADPEVLPENTHRALDRLRRHIFELTAPAGDNDSSVDFLSATDESRECVEIARSISAMASTGVRFDQMAIALRNAETYQPLMEDASRRARIPAYFTLGSRRPNPGGRALLALLACASERLSASRFSEYLSLGQVPELDDRGQSSPQTVQWTPPQGSLFPELEAPPIQDDSVKEPSDDDSPAISGSLRTPHQWETLLVDAAVIGGHDRWVRRLDGLRNELNKHIAEVAAEEESTRQHLERQLQRLKSLRDFALPIIEFLDRLPEAASWDKWLDTLEELVALTIRRPEPVLSVLAELRPMGTVGPVRLDEVREVLNHRLTFLRTESAERRYGKVFVCTPDELSGLSFEVVFLPGLAEDIFPRKQFEDPLLLDSAREGISPLLETQDTRVAGERLLLHIAAGAARSKLWISYPRMDLGRGRARSPSFYAVDVVRAITGHVPDLRELQRRTTTHSGAQMGWPAPLDPQLAIDDAEYDLSIISGLVRAPVAESRGRARYLLTANAALERSLRSRAGKWRSRWTEGDGIVSADDSVVSTLAKHRPAARPYSATALQQFAGCPLRFVFYAIHRMRPREEIVAIERLDPLTRGSFIHETQFRLLSQLRNMDLLPITSGNMTTVLSVADRVFDEVAEQFKEDLAPAIPRVWQSQMEELRWDVRGWLREMSQPETGAWMPKWFELSFGLPRRDGRDPVSREDSIDIGGGIRVRGAIDMIEERNGQIRITDHKTGKAPAQPPGITGHGEILQPVLYAQAAEVLLGKPAAASRLFYCTERGGYRIQEVPVDDHSRESLLKVISLIDQSIVDGFLPAAPRDGACSYCDYRMICGPYEELRVRRKKSDRLAVLEQLRQLP